MLISLPILYLETYFLEKGEFPCVLKHADIVPVHKRKEKKNSNANYGLLSIFPDLSEIYEKLIYQQLYNHFDNIVTKTMWFS